MGRMGHVLGTKGQSPRRAELDQGKNKYHLSRIKGRKKGPENLGPRPTQRRERENSAMSALDFIKSRGKKKEGQRRSLDRHFSQ